MDLPPHLSLAFLTIDQIKNDAFDWVWATPPNKLQEETDLEQRVTFKKSSFQIVFSQILSILPSKN